MVKAAAADAPVILFRLQSLSDALHYPLPTVLYHWWSVVTTVGWSCRQPVVFAVVCLGK